MLAYVGSQKFGDASYSCRFPIISVVPPCLCYQKFGGHLPPPALWRRRLWSLLPVFTGCMHLNASTLNWQSLSTEVFTALQLGVSVWSAAPRFWHHIKTPSPVVNLLLTSHPLSRLVTVGDRSFAAAGPRLWNTLPEDITSAPSPLVFRRKLKTHLFRQSYPDIIL